jgi:hypothetical protein
MNAQPPAQPPAPVTGKLVSLNITGYLLPVHENRQPVLLQIEGAGDDLFLPVFSTPEKLRAGMELAATAYDRIIQITDGREFLNSLKENTLKPRVILDPYKHESGMIRFVEVIGAS